MRPEFAKFPPAEIIQETRRGQGAQVRVNSQMPSCTDRYRGQIDRDAHRLALGRCATGRVATLSGYNAIYEIAVDQVIGRGAGCIAGIEDTAREYRRIDQILSQAAESLGADDTLGNHGYAAP